MFRPAWEENSDVHGIIRVPNAKIVVCDNRPEGVVTSLVPLLFAQLKNLLQFLPQVTVCFSHERKLPELPNWTRANGQPLTAPRAKRHEGRKRQGGSRLW